MAGSGNDSAMASGAQTEVVNADAITLKNAANDRAAVSVELIVVNSCWFFLVNSTSHIVVCDYPQARNYKLLL